VENARPCVRPYCQWRTFQGAGCPSDKGCRGGALHSQSSHPCGRTNRCFDARFHTRYPNCNRKACMGQQQTTQEYGAGVRSTFGGGCGSRAPPAWLSSCERKKKQVRTRRREGEEKAEFARTCYYISYRKLQAAARVSRKKMRIFFFSVSRNWPIGRTRTMI
jgi:hypothetical protein